MYKTQILPYQYFRNLLEEFKKENNDEKFRFQMNFILQAAGQVEAEHLD